MRIDKRYHSQYAGCVGKGCSPQKSRDRMGKRKGEKRKKGETGKDGEDEITHK
jgi:hypothetical protein